MSLAGDANERALVKQSNKLDRTPDRHVEYEGAPAAELSVATLWRVAVEWRWLILSCLVTGIALAVIVTLLTPPLYRSTTILELSPPRVEVTDNDKGRAVMPNDATFLGTQIGLVESAALAGRVAQDLNLAANEEIVSQELDRPERVKAAGGFVQRNLKVETEPQSRLLEVSFVAGDPQLAARIVNGVADGYINSSLERGYEASSYARSFLQRQIANVRRELETSERQLVAYAQQQGIINTATKAESADTSSLTGDSLVALNNALSAAQARRFAAEERFRNAQNAAPSAEVSERTSTLRQQREVLQAEYQDKLNTFRPEYPEMVRLRARISSLDNSIRAEAQDVRTSRTGTLRTEFLAAAAEERQLRGRVATLRSDVLNLRGRSIQYNILQRDLDTNRSLYEALLQKYKEIGVAGGIGNSIAAVVDRGQVPGGPYRPNLMINLLVGIVAGLVLGLGIAVVLEFVNDTIKTPDDVRDKLQLAFLGGIPTAGERPVDDLADTGSSVSEAYFSTANAIRFTTASGPPKTLLVTSTRPAEGKSTSAWALAQSYARLGLKVLLIDADMRKPSFVVNERDHVGLSHLLTTTQSLTDQPLPTEITNLWLLPCGPIPPSPAELVASPRMAALLSEASVFFDIVVIDGPPILGLADSPLLSEVVEATLMVVEAGKTRTRAAVESHNRLRAAGAHVVGAILTRYRSQASYGYGYGYGYGKDAYQYKTGDNRDRQIRLTVQRDD